MPMYVTKQLLKYKHEKSATPQDTLLQPAPRIYGMEAQNTRPPDTSPPLNKTDKKCIEQVVGSFLYYGRVLDQIILHSLSAIAADQAAPTKNTKKKAIQFLDYMAHHPNTTIRFYKSDMNLNVHSDASYLTAAKARSRAGGPFFLGILPKDNIPIELNGAIYSMCKILKNLAASAAEAELGALF